MSFLCLLFILSNKRLLGQYSPTFITGDTKYARKSDVFFNKKDDVEENLSRREILTLTVGGIAYAKVAASAITKIKRGDAYPEEHENRVSDVFQRSIIEAYLSTDRDVNVPLRMMEIGIGKGCRTVMRGLYDSAFTKLALYPEITANSGIEFIGLDLDETPMETLKTAKNKLISSFPNLPISFDVIQGDIVRGLGFPDGYFGKFLKKSKNKILRALLFKIVLKHSYFNHLFFLQT
jgi:hypothetical protein